MSELPKYRKVLTMLTLYFVALCLLLAALMPSYRSVPQGLILGSVVSWINAYYLGYKVMKVTDAAASGQSARRMGMGFGVRAALSILAVMMTVKLPMYFNVFAVVGSLVLAQFLILFIGIRFSKSNS
ncbi:ATP synthase protein I [Paenibacillus shirakamiensis]|uniref:ATP synthase protein I n=1 Tax=Paenibacillus shirakamiensis TaxID=1265935 RepID=A0ABS4JJE9_9BACL|nr:ATP synthase subunit I [Paenibacillus shirakamiensis]MBP2001822.1 ATP synthase protein I [Paenibacillus shirakamiensis]